MSRKIAVNGRTTDECMTAIQNASAACCWRTPN